MDCTRAKKFLKKYLHHATDSSLTQNIEEHLACCEHCRNDLDQIMVLEEQKSFWKKILPAGMFVILVAIAAGIIGSSLYHKKELTRAKASVFSYTPAYMPTDPQASASSDEQKTWTTLAKGDWVAVFLPGGANINPNDTLGLAATMPQEEGTVLVENKEHRYFRIPSMMNPSAIQAAISRLKEKNKTAVSPSLEKYLQSSPKNTETSFVYFYVLIPTAN